MHVTHWAPLKAGAAIAAYRLVEIKTADNEVHQAAADTAKLVGAIGRTAGASGDTVDIAIAGVAEVEAGADVTRGDLVTADADGKATPTTTAGKRIVGIAMGSAVAGDIFNVLLSPGTA